MKSVAIHTATVLATLAALAFLWLVREAVFLFLLSLGIAAALRPVARFLIHRRLPQWLAIAATYLIALGVPALLLAFAGQPLIEQTKAFAEDIGRAYEQFEPPGDEEPAWRQSIVARIPSPSQLYRALVGDSGASLLSTLLGGAVSVFAVVIDLALAIFLSIYWSIDRVHFERLWLSLLPARERAQTRELWRAVEERAGAYLRSEAIQSVSAAIVLWLGYVALGQRYPALLALICGLAWLIPWVGVLIAVTAVALLAAPQVLIDGGASLLTTALPAALYTSAVLLVLELAIEPRFFNRRRYNTLATAIVAIGLAELWGLFGLLLGPPVSAIFQIVAWQWMNRQASAEIAQPVPCGEDFETRFHALRDEIIHAETPRPELLSFAERLEGLLRDTRELAQQQSPFESFTAS